MLVKHERGTSEFLEVVNQTYGQICLPNAGLHSG